MAVSDLAAVEPPAAESTDREATRHLGRVVASGIFAGASFVYLTLSDFGAGGLGAAWSLAQLLLVFIACFDFVTRRIPNRVTLPAMAAVVVFRAVFALGSVPEALIAGAAGFAAFLLLVIVTRGGFGMGDVKLVGLLGLLLGEALLPALLLGIVAGGVASAVAAVASSEGRRKAIAYGPYLCLGAALGILAFSPPPLV
jgi:prepilin signal peptidase PulO-like enzyme (type II secretory pathway)